jgi:hypothetical protein
MRGLGIVLAACVLSARSAPAQAQAPATDDPVAQARAAVDASDYMTARGALDKALAAGGAQPDELAEMYKLLGIVDAALGDAKDSAAAFTKWLALDPKGSLPFGTSPKITRPFDVAKKKAAKLELKTETNAEPPWVALVIASDPVGITHARALVSVDGKADKIVDSDGKGRIAMDLPRGHRLDLRVEALDEHGNRVAVLGSKDVPIVIVTGDKPPPQDKVVVDKRDANLLRKQAVVEPHERSWYANWHVWGIAAIGATVVTGVFAYETRSDLQDLDRLNATSPDHQWSAAQDTESRARRDLLITDIGAGVTGALALGTAFFYLTRPHEEVQVVAVPTRGGGGLAIGGHF